MNSPCPFCGDPVNKYDKGVWKKVAGWVGGPRKDSMRLREDLNEYAHDHCVLKAQRGIAPDQADLFDANAVPEAPHDHDVEELGLD